MLGLQIFIHKKNIADIPMATLPEIGRRLWPTPHGAEEEDVVAGDQGAVGVKPAEVRSLPSDSPVRQSARGPSEAARMACPA